MANSRQSSGARSMGVKLIVVAFLVLIMGIPALFVYGLLWDRSSRAERVTMEVGGEAGGPQTLRGPILLVPVEEKKFLVQAANKTADDGQVVRTETIVHRTLVFMPSNLRINANTDVEIRKRSIFEVPVYMSQIDVKADFDADTLPVINENMTIFWDRARVGLSLGDVRGIKENFALEIDGVTEHREFLPGAGGAGTVLTNAAVSAHVGDLMADRRLKVRLKMRVSGAQRLAFVPVGGQTDVEVSSNWPHPGFKGAFLTNDKNITADGFSASWSIPYLARSLPLQGWSNSYSPRIVFDTAFGVDFVVPGNPYRHVARALKYALMFVGFVFLGYFLLEATSSARIHAAQYLLVGLAQVVFYLLLLSLAERIGFEDAYKIAAGATVALTTLYACFNFGLLRGFLSLFFFAGIYGLLYVLMRVEDIALLVGSIAAFIVLAIVMLVTRNTDWYGNEDDGEALDPSSERPPWSSA